MPAHPSTPASTQPGPTDLADLEALADQLHQRELPALLLQPPGKLPYVDTGLPQGMAPGLRIQAQAGMFFTWPDTRPIAPSDQPATAATIIARQLRPTTPQR